MPTAPDLLGPIPIRHLQDYQEHGETDNEMAQFLASLRGPRSFINLLLRNTIKIHGHGVFMSTLGLLLFFALQLSWTSALYQHMHCIW